VARADSEAGQQVFATPEDAGRAMFAAIAHDNRHALLTIFGQQSRGLLVSGDPVEDANDIQTFLRAYIQIHRFRVGPDGTLYLLVGAENWPMLIPLARGPAGWYFDTPHGKEEFLYRRIGENESVAIDILHAIAAAENDDYGTSASGAKVYAAKLISDPGQQDGLAWKAAGKPAGPLADLAAITLAQGYTAPAPGQTIPVHGYYFRILDSQGAHAAGGSKNYIVDGDMTNVFAVIASPAKYRSSGVMTFLSGPDGKVYERDFGTATTRRAAAITSYNPDRSWLPIE
jgi:hypothetical protein